MRASGECRAVSGSELVIATDASITAKESVHSGAFIATTGRWGLIAARYNPDICRPNCSEAMELRAVWYALKAHTAATKATVYIDSQGAVDYLKRWQQGDTAPPPWYDISRRSRNHSTRKPTLVALQEMVTANAVALHFEHVKGHAGDTLNEAADGLAGIGKHCLMGSYDTAQAQRRGESLAASFLVSYEQAQNS